MGKALQWFHRSLAWALALGLATAWVCWSNVSDRGTGKRNTSSAGPSAQLMKAETAPVKDGRPPKLRAARQARRHPSDAPLRRSREANDRDGHTDAQAFDQRPRRGRDSQANSRPKDQDEETKEDEDIPDDASRSEVTFDYNVNPEARLQVIVRLHLPPIDVQHLAEGWYVKHGDTVMRWEPHLGHFLSTSEKRPGRWCIPVPSRDLLPGGLKQVVENSSFPGNARDVRLLVTAECQAEMVAALNAWARRHKPEGNTRCYGEFIRRESRIVFTVRKAVPDSDQSASSGRPYTRNEERLADAARAKSTNASDTGESQP